MVEGLDWEAAQAKPRLKEHVTTFRSWADEGHLPSVYLVALAYLKGNGVAKDNGKAVWGDLGISIPGTGMIGWIWLDWHPGLVERDVLATLL
jgi:hypothetical protein